MDTEPVKVPQMSAVEESLAMANGFSSLRGKKLPPIKGAEFVADRINTEFQAWVDARMNEVMKSSGPAASVENPFTEEEFWALKTMARQIIARQNAAPVSLQPESLKPAVDQKKLKENNKQVLDMVRQLADMDNAVDSQGNRIEY
jgi:hypothetical protein